MNETLDARRRRAAYRAAHRGTKEMDWLVGRFADAHLATMSEADLAAFEDFLHLPDPQLQGWLMGADAADAGAFQPLVARIRAFHGLPGPGASA